MATSERRITASFKLHTPLSFSSRGAAIRGPATSKGDRHLDGTPLLCHTSPDVSWRSHSSPRRNAKAGHWGKGK
jgi:hypothetical protein